MARALGGANDIPMHLWGGGGGGGGAQSKIRIDNDVRIDNDEVFDSTSP